VASKGLVSLDVVVTGARSDLPLAAATEERSPNPLHALRRVLASLHHSDGGWAVAGLLRRHPPCRQPPRRDRAVAVRRNGVRPRPGLGEPHGEPGYSTPRAAVGTADCWSVNGVRGGGKYTVIPHEARRPRVVPPGSRARIPARSSRGSSSLARTSPREVQVRECAPTERGSGLTRSRRTTRDPGGAHRACRGVPGPGGTARLHRRARCPPPTCSSGSSGQDAVLLVSSTSDETCHGE